MSYVRRQRLSWARIKLSILKLLVFLTLIIFYRFRCCELFAFGSTFKLPQFYWFLKRFIVYFSMYFVVDFYLNILFTMCEQCLLYYGQI